MNPISLQDILSVVNTECQVVGDENIRVERVQPIDAASADSLSFCNKGGEQGRTLIASSHAKLMIVGHEHEAFCRDQVGKTFLVVANPRLVFARVVDAFFSPRWPAGVHPTATIDDDAHIEAGAYIGPYCNIGKKVSIGEGTRLEGTVTVYDNVKIGRNVIIRAGAVIGTDGYGFNRNPEGRLEKFPQIGGVEIGDDVEIGSNTCIARGALTNTVIGRGSKIDNLVHIAHNVQVGEDCIIIAHAQVAGSVKIGDRCWLAPSCTISNGIKLGDDVMVAIGSCVIKDVPSGEFVAGSPARPTLRKA